jgi:hypothetical protein
MSEAEREAAYAVWRCVPKHDRVEVCRLAKQRLPHPNPAVAAAASEWARAFQRGAWWRRVPPFVLPVLGVTEGILTYVLIPNELISATRTGQIAQSVWKRASAT